MFEFLSRMFSFVEAAPANAGAELLNAAIETAVDGTDPRLRLLSNYQKRLRPAAEAAIAHVWGLAAGLGSPADLSRAGFSSDPRIHLLFCSADSLQQTVSRDANVRAFLSASGNGWPEHFYALLLARKTEKRTLGVRLAGEVLQNDVPQTVLSFSEHRLVAVSPSLEETLVLIKRGAYRQLVHCALATLTAIKTHDTPLLRERLETMTRFHGGNEHPFWPHHRCQGNGDARRRLGEIDQSLARCDQASSLDDYLTVVAGVLASPGRSLHQDVYEATVDRMGVVQPPGEAVGTDRVVLPQVYLPGATEPNVTVLVRVPASEVLPDTGLKLDTVL